MVRPTLPGPVLRALVVLLLLLAPALSGCILPGDREGVPSYEATVRWTRYGIPHILADDWGGLGYGYGYAAARDHLCTIAEEYVTVAGERSRFFGSEGSYRLTSNGQTYTNLESDLFFTLLGEHPDLVASPLDGGGPELTDLMDGYVAGYNRFLEENPMSGRPAPCADEPWVRPITRADMVGRFHKLNLLASSGFFAPYIVAASPPEAGASAQGPLDERDVRALASALPAAGGLGVGSNAYAFGSEMTANGRGMLLGNPHFPWQGPERFHQLHLTIPGEVDVMGATLLGVPLVLIGFNEHVAWTHTVSTGWRFSLHELQLAPGDPTSYVVDGDTVAMETRNVTVETPEGPVTHTFYRSRFGLIVEIPLAGTGGHAPEDAGPLIPERDAGLRWDHDRAYALNDVNARNDRTALQFLAWNRAESFDGFVANLTGVHGIPWVNTIAASPDGRAFYGDVSVVPNYDAATIQECNTAIGRALYQRSRLPVLDGSRSECDPAEHPDAAQPGILPAGEMPLVETRGWLMNSNDDHWIPHPDHRLEGFSPMIGWGEDCPVDRCARSTRTRMGYVLLREQEEGTAFACEVDPGVACDELTLARLQHLLFADRLYVPEHELDGILAGVCQPPLATSTSGEPVDLTDACEVLARWDRRADTGSAGLPLFERFWLRTPKAYTTPFDPADPVHTPRGFVAADPRVRTALADAVLDLEGAGIPLEATAGETRFVVGGGERLPLHGAHGTLGSPSMLVVPFEPGTGFLEVVHGNSYVQTVTWDDDGTPRAEAVLTYSQSPHPGSPHRADQTRLYSAKRWVELPFTEEAILADPALEVLELSSR